MKTVLKLLQGLLPVLLIAASPDTVFSQCANGAPASTITYDTTVIGSGNSSRTFSFPKFNPAIGTLLSADLQSVVGLEYSYDLENQTSQNKIFKTKIVRTDDIYSTALDPGAVNAVNQTPQVPSLIAAHQQLHYGPARMNYTLSNSVTDARLINFMGAGAVDFDYETGTSAAVQGPLPWQLNFTSVLDTTKFSITYRYCATNLLSADLLFFSATAVKEKVLLTWRQAVIEHNRTYAVQMSSDGQHFNDIASITENNSGAYTFTYMHNSAKKMYFRIEQRNISGEIKYSNTRTVEPSATVKPTVRVYPSLYTGGNLTVNFPAKASWQINIYSAEGRRLLEAREKDVYTAQLLLPSYLPNGFYTVETINASTQERQLTRFVVQR
ncbi:MAG TPA: choice-of-anchor E domain-containing protein [Chitinophagaceae bacterium]|nr:choice-of-anchor E domain-containing protein [Chitinophagaceae bacterium]